MTHTERYYELLDDLCKENNVEDTTTNAILEIWLSEGCRLLAAIADELHELNAKKGERTKS
jgi:hypothetical protein